MQLGNNKVKFQIHADLLKLYCDIRCTFYLYIHETDDTLALLDFIVLQQQDRFAIPKAEKSVLTL